MMTHAQTTSSVTIVRQFQGCFDEVDRQDEELTAKFNDFFERNPKAADAVNIIDFGVRSKGLDKKTLKERMELEVTIYFNEPFSYGKYGHKQKEHIRFKLKREQDMFKTLLKYPNIH
jgi:hypothetical protein